jgi:hypothetical protein
LDAILGCDHLLGRLVLPADPALRAGGRGVVCDSGCSTALARGSMSPWATWGATLHFSDAGRALISALSLPSGICNVCRDGERVSNERFTRAAGWHPEA